MGVKMQQQVLKPKPPLLLQPNKSFLEKGRLERSDGLFIITHKVKNYFLLITIAYIISYIKPESTVVKIFQ